MLRSIDHLRLATTRCWHWRSHSGYSGNNKSQGTKEHHDCPMLAEFRTKAGLLRLPRHALSSLAAEGEMDGEPFSLSLRLRVPMYRTLFPVIPYRWLSRPATRSIISLSETETRYSA